MMNKIISKNKLSILIALLGLVLIAGAASLVYLDQQTFIIALSMLGFLMVLTILQFGKWINWVMLLLSIGAYGWIQYTSQSSLLGAVVLSGVYAASALLALLFSHAINRETDYILNQYSSSNVLIEELTVHDSLGLIKWHVFKQFLSEEFIRSRRSKKSVSVLMMRLLNYQDYVSNGNKKQAEDLMTEIARISSTILRTLDKVSRRDQNTLGAILPETSQDEAKIAASRVINGIMQKANAAVYIGISTFPEDAVNVDKLISRAEAALEFAITSEREQISYAQLNADSGAYSPVSRLH
ncbi:MAG: diguanylate cyclase [Chloroflexi bacterium]|nr:diguanylate cyclase [Chloroflexota bacterium]